MSVKSGVFVADVAGGTQTITGIGFQPKGIFVWSVALTATGFSNNKVFCFGFSDNVNTERSYNVTAHDNQGTSSQDMEAESQLISLVYPIGTKLLEGDVSSFDADGFTINWSVTPAGAYLVYYIVVGGDASANVSSGEVPGSTGEVSYTGVGFQPDLLLFIAPGDTQTDADTLGFGVAIDSSNQWAASGGGEDGAPTTEEYRSQLTTHCLIAIDEDLGDLAYAAKLVTQDADGFKLDWTTVGTSVPFWRVLAIKGGTGDSFALGSLLSPAFNGAQEIAGLGFKPSDVFFLSANQPTSGSVNAHSRLSVGVANKQNLEAGTWMGATDALGTSSVSRALSTSRCVVLADADKPASFVEQAAMSSFTSGGFILGWTDTVAAANQVLYLAMAGNSGAEQFGRRIIFADGWAGPT